MNEDEEQKMIVTETVPFPSRQFIDDCLGDFRCKPRDEPPTNKMPENGPFSKNYIINHKKNIDLYPRFHLQKFPFLSLMKSLSNGFQTIEKHPEEDNIEEVYPLIGVSFKQDCLNLQPRSSLLRLACDFFTGHKWNSFLQLAHGLILNTRLPGFFLMKNFLLFLYYKPPANQSDFTVARKFFTETMQLMEERYESICEYITFLIHHPQFWQSDRQFIADFHRTVISKSMPNKKNSPSFLLLQQTARLQEEYLEYVEWKSMQSDSMVINAYSTQKSQIVVSKMKTNFRSIMNEAERQELNLDIVALILLELYDYDNELEEAALMLQEYAEKFKDNLNAHVYLYEFLQKYHDLESDPKLKIESLKHIVRICPDSKYTLRLVDENPELTGLDYLTRIEMICKFLDYQCYRDSFKAWKILYKILNKLHKEDKANIEIIMKIIEYFRWKLSYWKRMHFRFDELNPILSEIRKIQQTTCDNFSDSSCTEDEDSNPHTETRSQKKEYRINKRPKIKSAFNKAKFLDSLKGIGFPLADYDKELMQFRNSIINPAVSSFIP